MDSRNGLSSCPPCCDTPPTQCCRHHCRHSPALTFSLPQTPSAMIPRPFDIPPNDALMTEECTDQCVVITCHDPDHSDGISCGKLYRDPPATGGFHPSSAIYPDCTSSCPPDSVCLGPSSGPCSSAQMLPPQGQGCGIECNPAYSNLNECADCVPNYFYDFLKYQCCTEPYSRMSSVSPHDLNATTVGSNSGLFWNQASGLCSQCGQERSMCSNNCLTPPYPGSTPHPHTSLGHPSPYAHNSSQVAGEGRITCQWGNCHATFSSPAELVGHVNLHHLYIPSMHTSMQIGHEQSPSTLPPLQTDSTSTDSSNISCQWRNCDKHPEPPSGHTCALSYEQWRDFIAVHVFKDHLGLPADIAEGTTENRSLQDDETREAPVSTESMGTDLDILSTPSLSPTLSSMTESMDPIPRMSLHTPMQEPDNRTVSSASSAIEEVSFNPSHRCRWHECTASFDTCEELTAHLSKVHVGSGRPIYECLWEGCSRNGEAGFGSRQKINRHLQSHTGHRPFQCNICHQNFSEAATLQQHMRRHTREKPYVCDHPDCGKAFAIAGALTIHKRTHNGQRPFKCPHCDRAFSESSNLSKHLRTHTGVKPYTCREVGCSKSFARPDQLSRHLLTHRRRERPPDRL